jgi:hypothetical protein
MFPPLMAKLIAIFILAMDMCIGGNLNNTVKKNRIKRNTVSGEEIILVLRKVDSRGLKRMEA